jgi:hypothetical protein
MTEPAVDVEKNFQESIGDYNYLLFLMNRPGNEELMGIYDVVLEKINSSTTKTITETEFDDITKNYTWFKDFDADKQIAEIAIAEDLANGTNFYEQKVLKRRGELAEDANLYGISFTEEQLTEIANKAEYDAYTAKELKTFLRDEVSFDGTQDLTGQAGDTQQALQQWSARNGLQIPADSLNNLIKSGAFGDQSFEDMKQQLRKTYLMGAFPGWESEIAAGADPYDLAAPYRASLASVLEMNEEDISFDDDLLSQAMQTKMTITDLKREARKDPRWDKTENALKTYTDAGTNILQMFGLR